MGGIRFSCAGVDTAAVDFSFSRLYEHHRCVKSEVQVVLFAAAVARIWKDKVVEDMGVRRQLACMS